jgi:hypothetical protein
MAPGVLSESAMQECVTELRAACRRPIDESALDALLATLRPQFQEILDRHEGRGHWTDHGRQMRDNARYIGCLADFLSYRADTDIVGPRELMEAFAMVRDACRVGAEPAETRPDAFTADR